MIGTRPTGGIGPYVGILSINWDSNGASHGPWFRQRPILPRRSGAGTGGDSGCGTNPHGFTFWNFSISRADTLFLQNWPVPDDLGPQPWRDFPNVSPRRAAGV